MKFELVENEKGEWWAEPVARNGRKLLNQWYSREAGAMKAIKAIHKGCLMADGIDKLIVRKPRNGKKAR